ncbi:protein ALP1-like [Rutidosis leptorrhynchoides]|uniref:protein ALP1-like n=1 Tax=Rutidosis leptorrhynchoides TaxID=125765 RepID=UPI003A99BB13
MWIWHAYFGVAGSNNDINVLNRSPLFDSIKNGSAPPSPFTVNGHDYTHGYYLVDSIYPDWATLIKAYSSPTDEPSTKFTRLQESARKDVERTFGVLQARFNILRVSGRAWRAKKMHRILYCCVLLHNMIQEDNGFAITSLDEDYLREPENRPVFVRNRNTTRAAREKEIRDKDVHNAFHADLTEHIWNFPPNYRRTI